MYILCTWSSLASLVVTYTCICVNLQHLYNWTLLHYNHHISLYVDFCFYNIWLHWVKKFFQNEFFKAKKASVLIQNEKRVERSQSWDLSSLNDSLYIYLLQMTHFETNIFWVLDSYQIYGFNCIRYSLGNVC